VGGEHWQPAEPVQPGSPSTLDGLAITAESIGASWRVLHVAGEIDMVTAPALSAEVANQFASAGLAAGRVLVFDLTDVGFIGSSGLAVLADAAQQAEERSLSQVRVVAASRAVRRAIEVTGMDGVLAIYPDLPAAIQAPGPE
jgi:anti-sigma B factor antagonist